METLKPFEINKNEALLKIRVIDLEEEIECIEEIKMHVCDPRLLDIRDRLEEWIFNTQPFNKIGLYTIKGFIDEYDDGLFCSPSWDFEVIDFKSV